MIHAPQTLAGEQAWEAGMLAVRLQSFGRVVVPVIDTASAIGVAHALGYDTRSVAWLVTAIAAGVEAAARTVLEDAIHAHRS